MNKKIVLVSGGFDPVHIGHLNLFEGAKNLGDKLIVILNCDSWVRRKKGKVFMNQDERAPIIKEFRCVDDVFILESEREDVCEALKKFKPDIFANGGDRRDEKDIPEAALCRELGIETVFNVGGGKVCSSSELLNKYANNCLYTK